MHKAHAAVIAAAVVVTVAALMVALPDKALEPNAKAASDTDCYIAGQPGEGGPAAPTGLEADLDFGQAAWTVRLSWTDNAPDETCYVIERRPGPPNAPPFQVVGVVPGDTEACFDYMPFDPDVYGSFYYRVYSATASGRSDYSDEAVQGIPIVDGTATPTPPAAGGASLPIPSCTVDMAPTPTPTPSPTYTPPLPTPSDLPTPTPTGALPIEAQLGDCLPVTDVVWAHNNQTKAWSSFDPDLPAVLQELTQLLLNGGYLIHTIADCTIGADGDSTGADGHSIPLYAGWNLFGWR